MKDLEKAELERELKKCDNLYEILVCINKKYDLKQAKIGFLTRPKIVEGIIKAVEFTKPPLKQ